MCKRSEGQNDGYTMVGKENDGFKGWKRHPQEKGGVNQREGCQAAGSIEQAAEVNESAKRLCPIAIKDKRRGNGGKPQESMLITSSGKPDTLAALV
jgi:hypothetical protein